MIDSNKTVDYFVVEVTYTTQVPVDEDEDDDGD